MRNADLFAEFLRRLRHRDPLASYDAATQAILLNRWEEEVFAYPMRVKLTPETLADHLSTMEEDGELLFPDVEPIIGAMQLFLVHIDETIQTRRDGHNTLALVDGDIYAIPDDQG